MPLVWHQLPTGADVGDQSALEGREGEGMAESGASGGGWYTVAMCPAANTSHESRDTATERGIK